MRRHPDQHQCAVPAARELRGRQTIAESMLWRALRNRSLAGLKFRRQHPVGAFVADFCCLERRLIIEVDGGIHHKQTEQDAARDDLLADLGYRVMRVSNAAFPADLPAILRQIRAEAEACPQLPPSKRGW